MRTTGEFDLVARIAARATQYDTVVLGIGDDAALLQPTPGMHLVTTTDALNVGVHFFENIAPADLGWKALAVNLSDLAAMGAQPAWCTLSLSLPQPDAHWLDAFLDGFLDLARRHGVALVGGDTTRGPLSVCVTALGQVEAGRALRRDQALAGQEVWVTGTPGDAAAALRGRLAGAVVDRALQSRLERPEPRVQAGRALLGLAHACVDVSDGLLADLGHICARSGVRAVVERDALPVSPALARFRPALRWPWQLAGGDDYELCFTAPPACRRQVLRAMDQLGLKATVIGHTAQGAGVSVLDEAGQPWQPPRVGYAHF